MSRIGRLPIPIPDGVKVDIDGSLVNLAGGGDFLAKALHDHAFSHTHPTTAPGAPTGTPIPTNTNPCTSNTTKTKGT